MDRRQSFRLWLDIIDHVEDGNLFRVQQLWETFQSEQSNHESVITEALVYNQHEIARWLIQNGADANAQYKTESLTPLGWAIHFCDDVNDVQTIQLLLEYGADLNLRDGLTLMHRICLRDHSKVKKRELMVEAAKLLIDHGADVNAKDDKGDAPLHLACVKNRLEMIQFLAENGANLNALNGNKETPFFWACRNRSFEVAKMLIDLGVKVDGKDHFGMTALHRACKAGDLDAVKFLLAHGADIRMKARQDKKLLLLKWLMRILDRLTPGPIGIVLLQLLRNVRFIEFFFLTKLWAQSANEFIEAARSGSTRAIGMVLWQLLPNKIRIMVFSFWAQLLARSAKKFTKAARSGSTPLDFACEANHASLVWFMVRQEPWRVERGVEGWERRAGVKR